MSRGMSQSVHESVTEINQESPPPTYEEVCNTSRVQIGFKGDLTHATPPIRTALRHDEDNRSGLLSTNQERVEESRANQPQNQPQTKKSKKCAIFSVMTVLALLYLLTNGRSKNCSLVSTCQHNSVEVENRIQAIHGAYDKKINYLNAQQKDVNRTFEKEINCLLHGHVVADIEKQKLLSEIKELRKEVSKVLGQREQLYSQLVKAGLTPVYDITASTTDRSDQESKKVTTSLYNTLFKGNYIFRRNNIINC